ncbi:hypothetical protein HQN89_35705 [Paenibacillus frigoriresistens]|nr:hypothetical protein [Paenibacillus frigoriresistens]
MILVPNGQARQSIINESERVEHLHEWINKNKSLQMKFQYGILLFAASVTRQRTKEIDL